MNYPLSFSFTLERTYYDNGFFNGHLEFDGFLEKTHEAEIIFLLEADEKVVGYVSREANNNRSARLFGGVALRDWFQGNFSIGDTVKGVILRENLIFIYGKKARSLPVG